jgi:tryptophan-rich sensory protein
MAATSGVLAWRGAPDAASRPDWALAEVVFLWLSVLAPIVVLAGDSRWASWLLVP